MTSLVVQNFRLPNLLALAWTGDQQRFNFNPTVLRKQIREATAFPGLCGHAQLAPNGRTDKLDSMGLIQDRNHITAMSGNQSVLFRRKSGHRASRLIPNCSVNEGASAGTSASSNLTSRPKPRKGPPKTLVVKRDFRQKTYFNLMNGRTIYKWKIPCKPSNSFAVLADVGLDQTDFVAV